MLVDTIAYSYNQHVSEELYDRLRRLGVTKGVRKLKPLSPTARQEHNRLGFGNQTRGTVTLARQFPSGRLEETASGACFVVDHVYPAGHLHGDLALGELLALRPQSAVNYCNDKRLAQLDFRDFVFLDTETTGLHGANTLAFLVGIAFFESNAHGDVLIVRQFFLRDHDDEVAMLSFLSEAIDSRQGLITFNGHSFDLTILENRYYMNRLPADIRAYPHIDLLPLARRLWRTRLGSVALGNLESELLGVKRTEADVPGWLIPAIYTDYLRTQDAREMRRVFYHNEIDMLSMVTLTSKILQLFGQGDDQGDPIDLFSLGKWQADIGLLAEAEAVLKSAVQTDLPLPIYHKAIERLGILFKRQQRHQEALPYWQQWAATSIDDVAAHVEIAKYYEWHAKDLQMAERWVIEALRLIESWHEARIRLIKPELDHRLSRLRTKLTS